MGMPSSLIKRQRICLKVNHSDNLSFHKMVDDWCCSIVIQLRLFFSTGCQCLLPLPRVLSLVSSVIYMFSCDFSHSVKEQLLSEPNVLFMNFDDILPTVKVWCGFKSTILARNLHSSSKCCLHNIQNRQCINRKKQKSNRASVKNNTNASIRTRNKTWHMKTN